MRKEEIFFDAITGIREELIEEAQNYVFRRRVHWRRYAGLAACLALAVALVGYHALLGSAGTDGGSTANTAPVSPGDAVSGDCGDAPENTSSGDNGGACGGVEQQAFTARVLEVHETYLLLEPEDGEEISLSYNRIAAPTGGLSGLADLQPGDRVVVTFSGPVQETEPARITGVLEISPVE